MAIETSSLGDLAAIREAQQRQGRPQQGQQAGKPPPGYGGAALGGMSEANLKQGFAEEATSMGAGRPPMPMPTEPPKQNLNEVLTATLPDGDSIAAKALEALTKRSKIETVAELPELIESRGLPIAAAPDMMAALQNPIQAAQGGGLMRLAAQDQFSGQVPGQGHGMEDNVYMPIIERQEGNQVGTLAVSPDEYVVDAHTMAAVGNGSPDAGADVMDNVIKNIRSKAYGTTQQPNEINGLAALQPLIERV